MRGSGVVEGLRTIELLFIILRLTIHGFFNIDDLGRFCDCEIYMGRDRVLAKEELATCFEFTDDYLAKY